jgi:hypothetical protein
LLDSKPDWTCAKRCTYARCGDDHFWQKGRNHLEPSSVGAHDGVGFMWVYNEGRVRSVQ